MSLVPGKSKANATWSHFKCMWWKIQATREILHITFTYQMQQSITCTFKYLPVMILVYFLFYDTCRIGESLDFLV